MDFKFRVEKSLGFDLIHDVTDPENAPLSHPIRFKPKNQSRLGHSRFPALQWFACFCFVISSAPCVFCLAMIGCYDSFTFGFRTFN